MSHTVTVNFEDSNWPTATMYCTEPADAECRAQWFCRCDAYWHYEVREGKPIHRNHHDQRFGEEHIGAFNPAACSHIDRPASCDLIELVHGEITFDVEPEWGAEDGTYGITAGGVTR